MALFGWTTYAVGERKQDFPIVITSAGDDTTADTAKTCQFTAPVVRITGIFGYNVCKNDGLCIRRYCSDSSGNNYCNEVYTNTASYLVNT